MSPFRFRFDRPLFFRAVFSPRKPRHPLVRAALGLLGLGVLVVLVFFSVFVGVAMLAAGLLYRLWKQRGKPVAQKVPGGSGRTVGGHAADSRVVDGEFRIVRKTALPSA